MSDEEKKKVLAYLDKLSKERRNRILASLDAFMDWLKNVFTWVYLKVKHAIRNTWWAIREALGFA